MNGKVRNVSVNLVGIYSKFTLSIRLYNDVHDLMRLDSFGVINPH